MVAKDCEIDKLYDGRVNIWVEDDLTRAYLGIAWHLRGAKFLVCGGVDAVSPAVENAQGRGILNVFGIIDGDFEALDVSRWNSAFVLRLPVHEIENFMLDPEAIARCDMNTNRRQTQQIELHMHDRASELIWWMATCSVIKRIRHCCLDEFIARPKPANATSRNAACEHLHRAPWFPAFRDSSKQIVKPELIEAWLDEAAGNYRRQLSSSDWKRTFSGKELFRHTRGFVFDDAKSELKGAMLDVDLAKIIARWQLTNNKVPGEVLLLRDTIKQRLNLA